MNYPRYLRGLTKITVILSIVMFFTVCVRSGKLENGFQALIAVPVCAIAIFLALALGFELFKWICKDFKKIEN